jgi:hypothetical protein
MAKIELDYVNSYIDVRGKPRHQFRFKGQKKVSIKGRPGSPEFMAHYHELLEKAGAPTSVFDIGASRTKAGAVDALAVNYFKSDVFTKGLAKATQKTWRAIIDRFRLFETPSGRRYGENSIKDLPPKAIKAFLNGKTTNAQKNSLKAIRSFIRYAVSENSRTTRPRISRSSRMGPRARAT